MGDITNSGAVVYKAGAGVSTSIPEMAFNTWISGAECWVNVVTRKNWSSIYSTLSPQSKFIIEDVVSSRAAQKAISYDMSGYSSPTEAQTMLDVLDEDIKAGIKELDQVKAADFIQGA